MSWLTDLLSAIRAVSVVDGKFITDDEAKYLRRQRENRRPLTEAERDELEMISYYDPLTDTIVDDK